ncbi:MAG: guanylate kinase [bacterium]|nr:MAG: guanylate kinase [bacterium]
MPERKKKPQLIVLSSPSGGGKTTICQALVSRDKNFRISISATTRPPRAHEKPGQHYHFISNTEFEDLIRKGEFLEYELVHGNYYGTLRKQVEKLLSSGYSVIFDIDVYGAINIKKKFPQAILIFIRPPSLAELKRRLKMRKSDNEEEIDKRLQRLPEEYAQAKYFDYDITNDDLENTITQIMQILDVLNKQDSHVSEQSISK